jgi:hypothetical protein
VVQAGSATTLDEKPSQQPTLIDIDTLDTCHRLHQGGQVSIARDDLFLRHEQSLAYRPELPLFDQPSLVAPFAIVPLGSGRSIPNRRKSTECNLSHPVLAADRLLETTSEVSTVENDSSRKAAGRKTSCA